MKRFLELVTDDLIARYGLGGLGEITMVFPMQRAGLFVRQYLMDRVQQQADDTPILLPHFTTIDALFDSLSSLRSEDEVVSICRLYAAYREHTEDYLPIDIFYGWGTQLMTDFSNSDMALLDVDKLMAYTKDAALLDTLQIDEDTRHRLENLLGESGDEHSVRRYYTSLWRALPDIYRSFTDSQAEDNVGTKGARSKWVIKHFEDAEVQQRIAGRVFVFVGFNYLLAAERKLMLKLQSNAQALFYWDYDGDFHVDESVYHFLREDMLHMPAACLTEGTSRAQLTAIACQSSAAQAHYVYQWLCDHHHEGDKTAIVLADENLLQSVIYSLPGATESELFSRVNVTKGYPLRQTRLYAQVIQLLEQAANRETDCTDRLQWLTVQVEKVYRSESRCGDGHWQQVLQDEAYYQIQLVLRELRRLLQRDEYAWVAEEIKDCRMMSSLIRRRIEAISIPFHGEPITDIQIIGVLETRLLDFDNVLILNVEEGVVPNTAVDRSFIPYDLRKAHGMQTRDEEAKIYGYNFYRLLRRAKNVTFTFSEATTEMGQKTMSRFLMQMLSSGWYRVERKRLAEGGITEKVALEHVTMQAGEHHPDHLSPSAISDFIECPREYYWKHIRHVHELDRESVMFTNSTLGTLVHSTLEHFYLAQKGNQPITISEALDRAYTDLGEDYHREEHEAENHVIIHMANEVKQMDMNTRPEILEMEKEFRMPLDLHGVEGTFAIVGKIDRIDRIKEGEEVLRVADYKTGKFAAEKMTFDTVDELFVNTKKRYVLQTLIYCAALRNDPDFSAMHLPIVPELLFPRNLSANHHLVYGKADVMDYQATCAKEFEEKLRNKVEEILLSKDFPMAEQKDCENASCYCPFHLLCGRAKKEYMQ